jgi:ribonuclease P protein component
VPANSDYRFPRELRVIQARHFALVFDGGVRMTAGPLVVWGAPNHVGHCRLGLAISRRVGTAPVRNRLRRLIRESFRLMRDDLPCEPHGYDVVVSARRHEPLTLQQYRTALARAVQAVDGRWHERSNKPNVRP